MNGVVIIDKPIGITSHDVVREVKKIFGVSKAGHTGTLDPIASGVLPICLNDATKLSAQLMEGTKEYRAGILFGVTTATFDTEGDVTEKAEIPSDLLVKIAAILPEFRGLILQKPPYFSAVKYKGQPLYKWARKGHLIDLPPREVEIKEFDIEEVSENIVTARIICSKGTYIRSLCHDLGQKIGCGAVMASLRRVSTGPFHIRDAVSLDELEVHQGSEELKRYVVPIYGFPEPITPILQRPFSASDPMLKR